LREHDYLTAQELWVKDGLSQCSIIQVSMTNLESVSHQPSNMVAQSIGQMFDRIAPVYDILNHILSFGRDFLWRRKLADCLDPGRKLQVLDLATGTGDVLISLLSKHPDITEAVGLDISENMLALCRKKITKHKFDDRVCLVRADVTVNPFTDESFDVVTMSFGIRNTADPVQTLAEIFRLLRPGGTAVILEFAMPTNKILRFCHRLYLHTFVPLMGHLLSGDIGAYRYLSTSIENFVIAEDIPQLLLKAGFSNVRITSLTYGAACLYQCSKPSFVSSCLFTKDCPET
jgi:demethylmenaquinone methyltransferase/2-methoxy-6-polyprenyl-1,4-benzoquinol methylase